MKKLFMKTALAITFLYLLMYLMLFVIVDRAKTQVDRASAEMRKKIGEKVVVDSDTLEIVNFSVLSNTFLLSNGVRVDRSFVIKEK